MRNRRKGAFEPDNRDNRVAIPLRTLLSSLAALLLSACSGGECRGPLVEVGADCPATYDGTEAQLPVCLRGAPTTQSSRTCGDLIQLSNGGGFGGVQCLYDVRSHALVGASISSDVSDLCGDSFTKSAGRMAPASCNDLPWTVMRQCQ